jgi:murein endopeptidase
MHRAATGSKIAITLAAMLTAAAVIAFAVTTALTRAGEPPGEGGGATVTAGGSEGEGPSRGRAGDPGASSLPDRRSGEARERAGTERPRIRWRKSVAVGLPHDGRLVRGVKLPAEGRTFFTWDPIHKRSPNRGWRRWGTDKLIRTILRVARDFARENPGAPRIAVGDLSRPRGGDFGPRFGSIGHASHQNGLDVDLYYPRRDRKLRPPRSVRQVDRRLAQELVDAFVAAGAVKVFVGPSLGLRGPAGVVAPLAGHDNHIHVRFRAR